MTTTTLQLTEPEFRAYQGTAIHPHDWPEACEVCEGTGQVAVTHPCDCLSWNRQEGCQHDTSALEPCSHCDGEGVV